MSSFKEYDEKTIKEMRESGLYPVVNLEIFKTVADLKVSDFTLEHQEDVLEKYTEYLDNIFSLNKKKQDEFLRGIKIQEILDTQVLEKEDSYLLGIYLHTHSRASAMDYLLKQQRYPLEALTKEEIIESHKQLLKGTSSEKYAANDYRTNDLAFVAKSGYGPTKVHYFTLPCKDIECALMNLTLYYNSKFHDNYTLIKPTLVHGLTGALQMFSDGNTRLGRMLQNIKTFELTEDNLTDRLNSPALFTSRSYRDYREQYRNKLADVAISPSDETWNNWINFNLNRMEDQVYYMNKQLNKYKKL